MPFSILDLFPAADTRLAISKGSMFKKRRQKGFLRALLCCFFRPEVAQEAQKPAQDAGSEVGKLLAAKCPSRSFRWLTFSLLLLSIRQFLGEYLGKYLLPQAATCDSNKLCLVIDLDETLVHSSFRVSKLSVRSLTVDDRGCAFEISF